MQAIVNECYLTPVVMNLDVSGQCQYRCKHCHHRRKQVHDQQLPDLPERLARTLPHFLQSWSIDNERVLGCCIVGSQGDALLYPHLPKLLKELHSVGIEVGLVTNGYGFDHSLLNHAAFYSKFIGFSMDAGTASTYSCIKHTSEKSWEIVCENISRLTTIIRENGLRNDVGWKILVLPDSQHEIYESCKVAHSVGCRYVQIRPADLPDEEVKRIDIDLVAAAIRAAIQDFEEPGKFEIVGVRHKFTPEFKQVLPKYCYLTPLTVTVTSDGIAYACVDRRCDKTTLIANCNFGWASLRQSWGSPNHVRIVHEIINRGGRGPDCNIRCSNYGYDKFFENYFVQDDVDRNLI
jgi:wyosine [tRNA(Phe)-imidazoG37] synthetase (radical SAM superfamily)